MNAQDYSLGISQLSLTQLPTGCHLQMLWTTTWRGENREGQTRTLSKVWVHGSNSQMVRTLGHWGCSIDLNLRSVSLQVWFPFDLSVQ